MRMKTMIIRTKRKGVLIEPDLSGKIIAGRRSAEDKMRSRDERDESKTFFGD